MFMEAECHALIMSRSHLITGFPPSQPKRMQARVVSRKEPGRIKLKGFSLP